MTEPPDYLLGRKPALIAASICLGLVVFLVGIPIGSMFAEQHEEIESTLARLAYLRGEAALRPETEVRLAAVRREATLMQGLMVGTNKDLAQSQLQTDMKSLVEANKGEVRSAQALPAIDRNGFEQISARYDIVLPVTRLRAFVYALEGHTPYLFIENTDISAPANWPQANDPKAAEPKLEIHWTIHAFQRAMLP